MCVYGGGYVCEDCGRFGRDWVGGMVVVRVRMALSIAGKGEGRGEVYVEVDMEAVWKREGDIVEIQREGWIQASCCCCLGKRLGLSSDWGAICHG